MKIELSKSFAKRFTKRIERYEFDVGINDRPRREPMDSDSYATQDNSIGAYAGGPITKMSRVPSPIKNTDVLESINTRLGFNILQRPFKEKGQNQNIIRFTRQFLRYALENKSVSKRRLENLLQAVIRNPILKLQYGSNSALWADAKGFDRYLFHTGQFFRSIVVTLKSRVTK